MEKRDQDLIEELAPKFPELKGLWDEHRSYERRLEKLERKNYLNPEEQQEKKKLQVAKLAGKTKIEKILMKHR